MASEKWPGPLADRPDPDDPRYQRQPRSAGFGVAGGPAKPEPRSDPRRALRPAGQRAADPRLDDQPFSDPPRRDPRYPAPPPAHPRSTHPPPAAPTATHPPRGDP